MSLSWRVHYRRFHCISEIMALFWYVKFAYLWHVSYSYELYFIITFRISRNGNSEPKHLYYNLVCGHYKFLLSHCILHRKGYPIHSHEKSRVVPFSEPSHIIINVNVASCSSVIKLYTCRVTDSAKHILPPKLQWKTLSMTFGGWYWSTKADASSCSAERWKKERYI